jgi:hypothetical protein
VFVGGELNLRTPVIFGDLAERLGGDAVNAIEEGAAHEEGAFRASCGRRYRHCHRLGRRLVVVAIDVIGTCETTGFCWIARPAVPRQRRVRAKRAREGRHATYDLGRNNLVGRNALLNPSHERAQEIDGVRPGAAVAVRHPGLEEQPGEFLRAMQTFLSFSLIVRALAGLTGINRS